MIRTILIVVLVELAASVSCAGIDLPLSEEMEQYLDHVRATRMSEVAFDRLNDIALYSVGRRGLDFQKDGVTGRYIYRFYQVNRPKPAANNTKCAEMQAAQDAEQERIVEALHEVADTDSSGFVSTKESKRLLDAFDFGIALRAGIEIDGPNSESLADAMRQDLSVLMYNIESFNRLSVLAEAAGLADFDRVVVSQ